MLHAIERLTNLYDLSKAFGSTIDLDELNGIIVRKAVDFGVAEVASFWLLDGRHADVVLAGTAVNENYDVENAPDAVGGSIVGDLLAEQKVAAAQRASRPTIRSRRKTRATRSAPCSPCRSSRRRSPVGALVLVNKRGRHPEFSSDDEELLQDLVPPGRPGAAQRAPVRGGEEGRGARRPPRRQPRDHRDARPRPRDADDRERDRRPDPLRPVRDRDPEPREAPARGGLRNGPDRPEEPGDPATEDLLQWVFLSGSDVNVTSRRTARFSRTGRRPRRSSAPCSPKTGFRAFYATTLEGRGRKARSPRLRVPRADRLRRGHAGPPRHPRQPGHGRRPQRPALPAGAPGGLLEASAGAAPQGPRDPAPPPARLGNRASSWP